MIRLIPLLTAMAGATPVLADIPTACTAASTFDGAVAQLEAEGWQVQARDADLTDAQTDALAWTLMTRYVASDTGGENPADLLDLQRRAAPGLLLRQDTDTTRGRVLLDGDNALTVTQTRTIPGRVERVCRLASAAAAPEGITAMDTQGFEGAPETLAEIVTILPEE